MLRLGIALLLSGFLVAVRPTVPLTDAIDTPTAVTLDRGAYDFSFFAYDGGSLLTHGMIGVHPNILLGVTFDVEHVIGEEDPHANIPGVNARIKFTDGTAHFPILIAAGYSSFYSGNLGKIDNQDNPYDRLIYGPYFVVTKPIFLLGSEQHFHFGIRQPVQPAYLPEDTSFFISFDFPLGTTIPIFEIERVYFDNNRLDDTLFNAGLRFDFVERLAIELNFISGLNIPTNRMLVIEYMDSF